jgi:hypothetical protein
VINKTCNCGRFGQSSLLRAELGQLAVPVRMANFTEY